MSVLKAYRFIRGILTNLPGIGRVFSFGYWRLSKTYRCLEIIFYRSILLPRLLRKSRRKDVLKVVFSAWNTSMWKYHGIYELMSKHPRFEPIVVLCPSPGKDRKTREKELAEMQRIFSERGYRVWNKVWQEDNFGFCKELLPDIVFFTQPYYGPHWGEELKTIFCYCHYGFTSCEAVAWQHNNFMQNIAWKIFQPTKLTIEAAKKCAWVGARNCVHTGYPTADEFAEALRGNVVSPWKPVTGTPKRIIWAPHFSIAENSIFRASNFLRLHQVMLELAEEFRGCVQWAFKPHPFLFPTLCKPEFWGEEKTKAYFKKWEDHDCAQSETGAYVELFSTSDAIIHDSGSFTIEYLYTQKPAMYLMIPGQERKADTLGKEALECYNHGSEKEEIRRFIEEVVLGGNDPKKEARERFYNKYLLPPNGQSVAQNILDEIERGLGWK